MTESMLNDETLFGEPTDEQETMEDTITDMDANDCIRKIANIEKYRKMWLEFYQKKIDALNDECDNKIAYQRRKLRQFFDTVLHRRTKTMEAYDLPNGRISMSFPSRKLVPDRASIVKRFIESNEREFIKTTTKEELDWNGYKSRLMIDDNGAVIDKETGEVVTDVNVEVTEPTFSVDPSNALTNEGDE